MAETRQGEVGGSPRTDYLSKASSTKVTALLASHNRRAETLACLSSYFAQEVESDLALSAVLLDAGSGDGTAAAVREKFPNTQVIVGRGDMFWARAMATAEEAARAAGPDFLLWLNDDVVLDRDALQRLMETGAGAPGGAYIAVGAVRDPVTGEVTYSGVNRSRVHPLRVDMVHPADKPIEVDTFNGNVVLVSRAAFERVGCIDGAFEHAAADNDYGLRAADAGVPRLLAPATVGTCARNPGGKPWADPSLTKRERFRVLRSEKGHPPRSRAHYLKRHGGPAWPVFWLTPYLRALPSLLRRRTRRVTQHDRP